MFKRLVAILFTVIGITLAGAGIAAAHDYTVKSGDTLGEIAADWEVPGGWEALYADNRDVVGGNPDLIYPGQELAIEKHKPLGTKSKKSEKKSTSNASGISYSAGSDKATPATGSITSQYGMRTHPTTGVYKLHTGTDYSVGDGNAYAAASGTVSVGWAEWSGNLVTVSHENNVQSRYAHLASVSVGDGAKVSAGDVIGKIGSQGYSTGAHLHFEVLIDGEFVDPAGWLGR
jgi:murein DD-endopeptidase MepM/ murein hydrolase activator NlpD